MQLLNLSGYVFVSCIRRRQFSAMVGWPKMLLILSFIAHQAECACLSLQEDVIVGGFSNYPQKKQQCSHEFASFLMPNRNLTIISLKNQRWTMRCERTKLCHSTGHLTLTCEGIRPLQRNKYNSKEKNTLIENILAQFYIRNRTSPALQEQARKFVPAGASTEHSDMVRIINQSSDCSRYNWSEKLTQSTVEDMPFCETFLILSWETWNGTMSLNSKWTKSIIDFMPATCRIAFFLVVGFDVGLACIIISSNVLLLLYHFRTKDLRSIYGYFVVSLAVADLLTGSLVVPSIVLNFYLKYTTPVSGQQQDMQTLTDMIGFVTTVSLCTPLLTLLFLSVFRYIAVARAAAYRYHEVKLMKIARICIISSWLIASALAIAPIVMKNDRYRVHPVGLVLSVKMNDLFLYEAILLLGLLTIWCINALSYKSFRKQMRRTRTFDNHSTMIFTTACKKRENDVTRAFKGILIAFSICTLPLIITQSFSKVRSISLMKYPEKFDPVNNKLWNCSMFVASRLVILNSTMNSFIIYFMGQQNKFKIFVQNFFFIRLLCPSTKRSVTDTSQWRVRRSDPSASLGVPI